MIKRLQKLKAKRGFTIIELIVVIAIITVLLAVVLMSSSSQQARIKEANTTAGDFFAAVQTAFTKYSLYESPLSLALKADESQIKYDAELGGNYPIQQNTYIEVSALNGAIQYVCVTKSGETAFDLYGNVYGASTTLTPFEEQLKEDIESRMDFRDGHYYAWVEYVTPSGFDPTTDIPSTVKVKYALYRKDKFMNTGSMTSIDYAHNYLTFTKQNVLNDGSVCGVCTSTGITDTSPLYGATGTVLPTT